MVSSLDLSNKRLKRVTFPMIHVYQTSTMLARKEICQLGNGTTETITEDVRLTNNFVYQLQGAVFVGEDLGGDISAPIAGAASATLTIDSGTTLYGTEGEDYLVIRRGSQIRSNGTALAPVIFTSEEDVFQTAGFDAANDRAQAAHRLMLATQRLRAGLQLVKNRAKAHLVNSAEMRRVIIQVIFITHVSLMRVTNSIIMTS